MRFNLNQKYFTIAAYATGAIIVSALAILVIFKFDSVMGKLSVLGAVLIPVIIGVFVAYLLNPLMMVFENKVFRKWSSSSDTKKRGRARGISLTLTMLVVVLAFVLVVAMVIPQLVENIVTIFSNMDSYIATVNDFLNKIFEDNPTLLEFFGNPLEDFSKFVTDLWNKYSSELLGFAGNVASGIWSVLSAMYNVIIGLIISIYLLAKKEMFIGQTKKLIFASVKVKTAQRFLAVCREASKKFLGSIVGKIMEALLVAAFCFIGCTIMGMPYSLLIAVIMFVFNLVPFIGPFIGMVPCTLLLLLSEDPIKALWFLIFMIILQNVDGNIIAPWILGDSTGLPAVWILISILVGGGLFGILGMFLGVPVCAVIYMLFKEYVEEKLRKRKLPLKTDDYVGDVGYITPDYVCEESVNVTTVAAVTTPEIHKPTFREIFANKKQEYKERFHIKDKEEKASSDKKSDIKK
ncbi:MAG: AI-2E family transporter [Oscillospiraceae bacterium]|nr:AI-2E family transporter [Oscillospiraceae bacterium]